MKTPAKLVGNEHQPGQRKITEKGLSLFNAEKTLIQGLIY
jgi:hypothetical protein